MRPSMEAEGGNPIYVSLDREGAIRIVSYLGKIEGSVVGRLELYRTYVLLYCTYVLLARPTKVRR